MVLLSSSLQYRSHGQRYFTLGYLNKHEGDAMLALVEHFSELGKIKAKKNGWSGGSYVLESATVIDINPHSMQLDVNVQERSKPPVVERVTIELGTYIIYMFGFTRGSGGGGCRGCRGRPSCVALCVI